MVEPTIIEITPRINFLYENIEKVGEGATFTLYQGKSRDDGELYTLRVFNPESDAAKTNYDLAATIFFQEIFHLSRKLAELDAVVLENFEFFKGKIVFVTKCHYPINKEIGKTSVDLEQMVKDVISDVKTLYTKLKLGELTVDSKTIHRLKGTNYFFLTDWANSRRVELQDFKNKEIMKLAADIQALSIANREVHTLGIALFEMSGVVKNEWEGLFQMRNTTEYNKRLDELVLKIPNANLHPIMKRIFDKDLTARLSMIDLLSEYGGLQQKKIAWCSLGLNTISIYDMQLSKLTEGIRGAALKNQGGTTYLQEIPNSEWLLSAIHNPEKSATFEVFNTAKGKHLLFSFDEKKGAVGTGDVSVNPRTLLAPLVSIKKSVGYHLFDCNNLRIVKKGKWQAAHKAPTDSYHLSPDSQKLASIDWNSLLVISDINNDNMELQAQLGKKSEWFNKCRWNPLVENPVIAVKYDRNKFNIYDVNTHSNVHNKEIVFDNKGDTMWIEWKSCGNLLATCGSDREVRIYDRREGKIVKRFEKVHEDLVYCVKLNLAGNLIGTASRDRTVKIVEFTTEKPIYSSKAADQYYVHSLCFIDKAAAL